jgi:hypothetical protein
MCAIALTSRATFARYEFDNLPEAKHTAVLVIAVRYRASRVPLRDHEGNVSCGNQLLQQVSLRLEL